MLPIVSDLLPYLLDHIIPIPAVSPTNDAMIAAPRCFLYVPLRPITVTHIQIPVLVIPLQKHPHITAPLQLYYHPSIVL